MTSTGAPARSQREQEAAELARLADTLNRPERQPYESVTTRVNPFALLGGLPSTPDPKF